ncbi:outer membrane protein OmpA-like peptidoglycan-associated protein [Pseudomonas sp. BIGb0408]|uniref:Outer membrane protein OmpA-like peptidoglycan-associated protein n=1 Tax=Phytopseudomonas flavescens TaxID=29435 RepID=A0A7Y9XJ87_9GAMM|nr:MULTISPECIES: OmpA family protein [Pseudomonas]MCW2293090.1 outer membrane protein OmpA-like peptidoglycan-associated protein [Pseudomonas sp. BIGb0408]NYH72340.1 outer membrane protein OmpA-like peptidoglycan-associated protein [Pseudomonas flavescens]
MSLSRMSAVALVGAVLSGCAGFDDQHSAALDAARSSFQSVREDPQVLRSAPKDVIRAGESLGRAERLSGYWGSGDDVAHYAYLSQRYSEIAREHAQLALDQERAARLELERQRLQLALREAKLTSVQEQNAWLEEQIVSLATAQTDRGLVMTLGDVLFDAGEAHLKTSANRTVLKLVQFLQLNPRRVLRIEGYTDSSGKREENLQLSRDRAQTVADALIDLGIDAGRIEVQGFGESFPVAENASAKGKAQNRRVEILFSDEQGRLGATR